MDVVDVLQAGNKKEKTESDEGWKAFYYFEWAFSTDN